MADDQNINLTASFKATADTSAFDKAVAAVEKLESKIKGLETLQSSLSRSQQVAERARERIQEEGLKGAAAKAVLREAASAINTELGLSGRTAQQLKDAKIDPTTIANAAKTLRGFGEMTETLGKLSGQVSEKTLQPLKDRLTRDQGILERALAGNVPVAKRTGFISGQEVPAGMTAAQARALESRQAPSVTTSDAEALARSSEIRSKAAKQTAQVKENAAKVEQAVVQTIQTAAESLKQAASAASSTGPARGRIRQATGTSRIIGEALLGAGTGAGAGAGAGGARARRPFGYEDATNRATDSLNREARAARETAVAMKALAQAKQEVVAGEKAVASSTGRVIDQLMREMKAAPKAAAALHQMLRRMEAANNPRYARGYSQMGQSIQYMGSSADSARRSFAALSGASDSFLGQVKQVAVLATSFSVLQGVASKLQEGFSHLTGGIIGFNQMLERTYVGFNRLFENQEQQVQSARSFGDMTQEVEYLAMGYDSASAAASGVVETIRQFANVTPFRFQELAQATLRMRAFGFGLDEVLYKSEETESGFDGAVVAIGDAVSALGGGAIEFQRITYALGQMKQAGRVYQNDMMQLANAGIGGYRYIADKLKKEITVGGTGQRKDVKAQYKTMYDELSKNAIETVRRLTTNGQISGEAAARAIIEGLKTDFGNGMKDFSQTFVGAWSTLADTSQSLVATAFEPFYKDFVYSIYQLGQYMQSDGASRLAESFQPMIKKVSNQIFSFVNTSQVIIRKLVDDITGAFDEVGKGASRFGISGADVFKTLRSGIGVVSGLLQNDMTRSIITATIAFKSLMSFASANPMLTTISLILLGLGALQQAYQQNFLGFKTAIDNLVISITPLVESIKNDLVPVLAEVGAFVAQYIVAGLVLAFRAAAPVITIVVGALAELLKIIKPLAPIVAGLVLAFGAKFGYDRIARGFEIIGVKIARAAVEMRQFGRAAQEARAAAESIATKQKGVVPYTGPGQIGPVQQRPGGVRAFASGVANNALGIGTAGVIASSIAEMAGVPEEITSVVSNVSSALMGFGILKQLFPGSVIGAIKSGLSGIGTSIGTFKIRATSNMGALINGLKNFGLKLIDLAKISWTTIVGGIANLATAIRNLGGITGIASAVGTAVASLGGIAGTMALIGAGIGAVALAIVALPVEFVVATVTAIGILVAAILGIIPGLPKSQDLPGNKPTLPEKKAPKTSKQIEQERLDYLKSERQFREEQNAANDATLASERKQNAEMDLLVKKEQKAAAAAERRAKQQEKYNRLLQQAQRSLEASSGLLEDLAKGALENLLDPRDLERINPYTGMAEAALELEDVLRIEQSLLITNFETAQGITKSFEEYADILDGIVPLQEKDRTEGKLNLMAVRERLKIEKERRKELDLIRKSAEIEYDLGLASLNMYDESIDPLQRAVQLRQAQRKYEQDVQDVRMSGLEMALDQAESSSQWLAAEKVIEQKLSDIGAGQDLILQELERRFEVYNQRVADIMANPDFSSEERQGKLKEALDSLTADLESSFGITKDVLQAQFDLLNTQIGLARSAPEASFTAFLTSMTNPTIPGITWGQSLGMKLGAAFDQIYTDMLAHFKKISDLAAKIKAVASGATGGGGGGGTDKNTATTTTPPKAPPRGADGAFTEAGTVTINDQKIKVQPGDTVSEAIAQARAREAAAKAAAKPQITPIIRPGIPRMQAFASGGMMRHMGIIGERGPEIFMPQRTGLVLNNSISSRLLGMLSGKSNAGNSVIINVNNPVIRNDNDIRKLAQEISRVQASQFRTEGGRL